MKKLFFLLSATLILATILSGCKKNKSSNSVNGNDSLFTIINPKRANASDTLQSYYSLNSKNRIFYYGSYDGNGNPSKIRQMVISINSTEDSLINMCLDDNGKIKSLFLSVNGVKQNSIVYFSYSGDSITTDYCKVNWVTGNQKVVFRARYLWRGKSSFLVDSNSFAAKTTSILTSPTDANIAACIVTFVIVLASDGVLAPEAPEISDAIIAGYSLLAPKFDISNTTVTPKDNPITQEVNEDPVAPAPPPPPLLETLDDLYICHTIQGPTESYNLNSSTKGTYTGNFNLIGISLEIDLDKLHTNVLSATSRFDFIASFSIPGGYSSGGPYSGSLISSNIVGNSVTIAFSFGNFNGIISGNTITGTFSCNLNYQDITSGDITPIVLNSPVSFHLANEQ